MNVSVSSSAGILLPSAHGEPVHKHGGAVRPGPHCDGRSHWILSQGQMIFATVCSDGWSYWLYSLCWQCTVTVKSTCARAEARIIARAPRARVRKNARQRMVRVGTGAERLDGRGHKGRMPRSPRVQQGLRRKGPGTEIKVD